VLDLGEQQVVRVCVVSKPVEPIHPGVQVRIVDDVEVALAGVVARLTPLVAERSHPIVAEIVLHVQRVAIRDGHGLFGGEAVQGNRGAGEGQTAVGIKRLLGGRPVGELLLIG
jgi:hypothetical protein